MDEIKKQLSISYEEQFDMEELSERRLWINEEICNELVGIIVFHIMRYNREDTGKPKEDRKPIYLYINTPGGDVTAGYSLVDAITNSVTPVYTVNLADCASMGVLVFIAGHKRFSFPHSRFLMHDGATAGWDSTAKMKDRMMFETIQVEEMTKQYVISHTNISNELYDEKYRMEWYFLPEEAKKYGIVDEIVGITCSMDDICGVYKKAG